MKAGHYLAFEGIEGAGKSSVAAAVAARLTATRPVLTVREPGGTPLGEQIRQLVLHGTELSGWAEALLFAAARAQLAASVIRPALAAGSWVVSDRSVYSSLAYQGIARGLGLPAVEAVNRAGLEGTWPDTVVLLRLSSLPELAEGLSRQQVPDRIGAEGLTFQTAAAAGFDLLATAEPERFVVVEAGRPFDVVVKTVLELLERRLG